MYCGCAAPVGNTTVQRLSDLTGCIRVNLLVDAPADCAYANLIMTMERRTIRTIAYLRKQLHHAVSINSCARTSFLSPATSSSLVSLNSAATV